MPPIIHQTTFDVVTQYGARGDGVTDDYPAFQAALDDIEAQSSDSGAILHIPFGTSGKFFISKTLHIVRPIVIDGAGAVGFVPELRFPDYTDGIVVHASGTAPTGHPGYGAHTLIRNIAILGPASFGFPFLHYPPYNEYDPLYTLHGHGIVLFATATVRDCVIMDFRLDGIHLQSDDNVKLLNSCLFDNLIIQQNGRHGVYAQGANANACRFSSVILSDNAGWGVYDRSAAGNNYVSCLTQSNGRFMTDIRSVMPYDPKLLLAAASDGGVMQSVDGGTSWRCVNVGFSTDINPRISSLVFNESYVPHTASFNFLPPLRIKVTISVGGLVGMRFNVQVGGGPVSFDIPALSSPFNYPVPGTSTTLSFAAVHYTQGAVYTVDTSGNVSPAGPVTVVPIPTITITTTQAGALGTMQFTYRIGTGPVSLPNSTIATTPAPFYFTVPGTQTTVSFPAAAYNAGTTYMVNGTQVIGGTPALSVGFGVFKLSNYFATFFNPGATWQSSSSGLTNQDVRALVFAPCSGSGSFFAGTNGGGVFSSADGLTLSWSAVNTGLPANAVVNTLSVDTSSSPPKVYAGIVGSGVYWSNNGGAQWNATASPPNLDIRAFAFFANSSDI